MSEEVVSGTEVENGGAAEAVAEEATEATTAEASEAEVE